MSYRRNRLLSGEGMIKEGGFLYWLTGKLYELLDWWEHRKDGL